MFIKKTLTGIALALTATLWAACTDTSSLEKDMDDLSERLDSLETVVSRANANAIAVRKFADGSTLIVGIKDAAYGYTLELSDGTLVTVTYGDKAPSTIPIIGISADGDWTMSLDGGATFSVIKGASNISDKGGATPKLKIDENGFWLISYDDGKSWEHVTDNSGKPISATDGASVAGKSSYFSNVVYDRNSSEVTFTLTDGQVIKVPVLDNFYLKITGFHSGDKIRLNEEIIYETEASDVSQAVIKAPEGWRAVLTDKNLTITGPSSGKAGSCEIDVTIVSSKGYIKNIPLVFALNPLDINYSDCKQWNDFVSDNSSNVLLDYSYAGYNHGESAPSDVASLGYTTYDVTAYGAIPNDGKSDRDAFMAAYQTAIGAGAVHNPDARAIIFFPEGEFILHTSADDADGKSSSMLLRAGHFVLKGAGRDKTTIIMQDPNLPASSALYSSPVMIELKHNSGLSELTSVTGNAAKGSFEVKVGSTSGISEGDWVCLFLKNNDPALIAEELAPYSVESGMTDLINDGVKVCDYHQVKKISGDKIEFYEPIMHKVDAKWGWTIDKYPHYEEVGVEDITFKGNAKADFVHHGSWQDDGAYKPVNLTRITNGWMRRVRFTSVSEASTITNCANVSVYDVIIDGNRGHSGIRAQYSSRSFIGDVIDKSSGNLVESGTYQEGTGQYHASGVSKPSIGTVLWRNTWGTDGCFESHATQPRATLLDHCKGAWLQFRQGGDAAQVPNHLADLTIWNFESVNSWSGTWDWWKTSSSWWKFLPPVIVGFHGGICSFDPAQVTVDSNNGTAVEPESLYEAQLRLRLGYVPAWLNSLK